ncbi:hypothetical protein CDAR_456431 [Caerostris darwini]|uniref:Uncharacterized protein n=1 Tax=Caerostris darwini TaxID=1538125 RepID=A0AAV4NYX2_9ARAC|nr:hypothetical protein CDAR_456431 [Caerostris darwini]
MIQNSLCSPFYAKHLFRKKSNVDIVTPFSSTATRHPLSLKASPGKIEIKPGVWKTGESSTPPFGIQILEIPIYALGIRGPNRAINGKGKDREQFMRSIECLGGRRGVRQASWDLKMSFAAA